MEEPRCREKEEKSSSLGERRGKIYIPFRRGRPRLQILMGRSNEKKKGIRLGGFLTKRELYYRRGRSQSEGGPYG